MTRTPIYTALVKQLQGLTSAPYNLLVPGPIELGLQHASDLPPSSQPAIFVMPSREKAEYVRGLPQKWYIECELYVYAVNGGGPDGQAQGVTQLLPILDGIDLILSPQVNQRGPGSFANDLGLPGTVYHCAVKGSIEIFGGYVDSQTIARIPIEIVTAG